MNFNFTKEEELFIEEVKDFIKEEDAKADALIKQINGDDSFLWRNF